MKNIVLLIIVLFVLNEKALSAFRTLEADYITNVFSQSNFVKNPNARVNTQTVTASAGFTVARSITTPLFDKSEFNLTSTAASGSVDWSLREFDAGMKNQTCEARLTYKGFTAGVTKAQIVRGATNALVAEAAMPTSATDPKTLSFTFSCGDLTQVTKFRILQSTAALSGTNEIGGIYVGLDTAISKTATLPARFFAQVKGYEQAIDGVDNYQEGCSDIIVSTISGLYNSVFIGRYLQTTADGFCGASTTATPVANTYSGLAQTLPSPDQNAFGFLVQNAPAGVYSVSADRLFITGGSYCSSSYYVTIGGVEYEFKSNVGTSGGTFTSNVAVSSFQPFTFKNNSPGDIKIKVGGSCYTNNSGYVWNYLLGSSAVSTPRSVTGQNLKEPNAPVWINPSYANGGGAYATNRSATITLTRLDE